MEKSPRNILIADDHFIVQGGMQLLFSQHFSECILSFASNYSDIIQELEKNKFDLIILDVDFEENSSLFFISDILKIQPNLKVLIYSGTEEEVFAPKFSSLGIKGFLSKNSDEEVIIKAIVAVLEGKYFFENKVIEKLDETISNNNPLDSLSKREFEVMICYAKGYGNLEISNTLNLKNTTISTYKKRIFEKLSIKSIPELVKIYEEYAN